tara:strand:+ start:2849 stop:2977 length:129 start_codon:yes stop_codon:yes gene_type:complete
MAYRAYNQNAGGYNKRLFALARVWAYIYDSDINRYIYEGEIK